METFKNIINQFKDPELLIIIGCLILGLILLRLLRNFLDRHKILKAGVIGIILISLVVGAFWFVDHRKDFYANNATNYVYGEVKNISSAVRKVEVQVIHSNLTLGKANILNSQRVVVDININCKFLDKNGNEISFDDIGFYDTVQIYVKENNIDDVEKDNLSGVKLILKDEYNENK